MSRAAQGTSSVWVPDSATWPVLGKLVMGSEAQLGSWSAGATGWESQVWPPAPLSLRTRIPGVSAPGGPAFHSAQPWGGGGGCRRVLCLSLSPQPRNPRPRDSRGRAAATLDSRCVSFSVVCSESPRNLCGRLES